LLPFCCRAAGFPAAGKFTIDPDMSATDWRPPGRRDLRSINAGLMATIVGRRERGLGASTQANRARAGLAGDETSAWPGLRPPVSDQADTSVPFL